MRILAVQDADWTKKGPHQQHHLMERLSTKGHEVRIVGFNQLWRSESGSPVSPRIDVDGIHRFYPNARIHYVGAPFLRLPILDYISFAWSVRKEIRNMSNFKPDLVVGFTSIVSCYWGARFAKRWGIPFVYYWTDVIHTLVPYRILRVAARLIERDVIESSSALLTINETLKDHLVSLGAREAIIQVVPGGVEPGWFRPSEEQRRLVRQKYGIHDDEILMFFMGWLYPFSGLGALMTEMAKESHTDAKLKLMIAGSGEHFEKLCALRDGLRIQNRVIMLGQQPYSEIPTLLSAADLCLLPSDENSMTRDIVPIKMYEYLASGKPVIATRLPGVLKEFGEDHGVIYVNQADEVVKKVLSLSKNDMSDSGSQAVKFIENFDWQNIVDRFESILRAEIVRM